MQTENNDDFLLEEKLREMEMQMKNVDAGDFKDMIGSLNIAERTPELKITPATPRKITAFSFYQYLKKIFFRP